MALWLLKTEPDVFGWDAQRARGAAGEPWTGVRNHAAKNHLKAMATGDRALFYHTGEERRVMGVVRVVRAAYPDPTDATGAFVCVDVAADAACATPVALSALKADPALSGMVLVRQPRLSVQPVTADEWAAVERLAGGFIPA